jgi:hypothetical protein
MHAERGVCSGGEAKAVANDYAVRDLVEMLATVAVLFGQDPTDI